MSGMTGTPDPNLLGYGRKPELESKNSYGIGTPDQPAQYRTVKLPRMLKHDKDSP